MVELLVKLGADPDIRTPENATLLYIAAQNNHPMVINLKQYTQTCEIRV